MKTLRVAGCFNKDLKRITRRNYAGLARLHRRRGRHARGKLLHFGKLYDVMMARDGVVDRYIQVGMLTFEF